METKKFTSTIQRLFTIVIISTILMVIASCSENSVLRIPNKATSIDSAVLSLKTQRADLPSGKSDSLSVYIQNSRVQMVTRECAGLYVVSLFDYTTSGQVIIRTGNNVSGVVSVLEKNVVDLRLDGLPASYTATDCQTGLTLTGEFSYTFYPDGGIKTLHLVRSGYQSVVKDHAIMEFVYDDGEQNPASALMWARVHPEVLDSLTISQGGIGEYLATLIYASGRVLKKMSVSYALEDPVQPGKATIEYDGQKIKTSHQLPGRAVVGGNTGDWRDINFLTYQLR
ncbi:MAG: hypothetical protein IJV17_05000 [Prevotella sp.]|nr:hypothetical protein [Prevotella sp.]